MSGDWVVTLGKQHGARERAAELVARTAQDGAVFNAGWSGCNAVQEILSQMRPVTAALLMVLCASLASAQPPAGEPDLAIPDFRVQVVGSIGDDFQARMSRYLELRRTLEVGLPPLTVTNDPANIGRAERALARQIRAARGPRQGELFTPAIAWSSGGCCSLKRTRPR